MSYSAANADGAQYSVDGQTWLKAPGNPASIVLPADGVAHTVRLRATRSSDGAVDSTPAAASLKICPRAGCSSTQAVDNLALGRPARASSSERSDLAPEKGNDGSQTTRWGSAFQDNQWWQVDLGAVQTVGRVSINWFSTFARSYRLSVSQDGTNWTAVKDVSPTSDGWKTTTFAPMSARYVRVTGLTRDTRFGVSFYEFCVFAS